MANHSPHAARADGAEQEAPPIVTRNDVHNTLGGESTAAHPGSSARLRERDMG